MSAVMNHFYDLQTKEYKHSTPAQISKKGVPLPAYGSTTTAPLDPKVGYAVIWNGQSWEYAQDHRRTQDAMKGMTGGTPYWLPEDDYQSEARYMSEIGPLPENAMTERPKEPVEILRQRKKQELNSAFQMAVNGSVEVGGMTINASETAYNDISRLIAHYTEPVSFRLFDNTHTTVEVSTLEGFQKAVSAFLQSARQKKWDYLTQIDAASESELKQLTFAF